MMRLARLFLALSRFVVARASRTAAPASAPWNVAKTLAQTVALWLIFLCVLPRAIQKIERRMLPSASKYLQPRWARVGQVLFACAGLLGLWSGATMALRGLGTPLPVDAARELVVVGPYRRVRNPMALTGLAQGVAVGMWMRSPLVMLYALCGAPVWGLLVRPGEEDALEARFGDAYRDYRSAVRLWLPRLQAYDPGE